MKSTIIISQDFVTNKDLPILSGSFLVKYSILNKSSILDENKYETTTSLQNDLKIKKCGIIKSGSTIKRKSYFQIENNSFELFKSTHDSSSYDDLTHLIKTSKHHFSEIVSEYIKNMDKKTVICNEFNNVVKGFNTLQIKYKTTSDLYQQRKEDLTTQQKKLCLSDKLYEESIKSEETFNTNILSKYQQELKDNLKTINSLKSKLNSVTSEFNSFLKQSTDGEEYQMELLNKLNLYIGRVHEPDFDEVKSSIQEIIEKIKDEYELSLSTINKINSSTENYDEINELSTLKEENQYLKKMLDDLDQKYRNKVDDLEKTDKIEYIENPLKKVTKCSEDDEDNQYIISKLKSVIENLTRENESLEDQEEKLKQEFELRIKLERENTTLKSDLKKLSESYKKLKESGNSHLLKDNIELGNEMSSKYKKKITKMLELKLRKTITHHIKSIIKYEREVNDITTFTLKDIEKKGGECLNKTKEQLRNKFDLQRVEFTQLNELLKNIDLILLS